MKSESWNNFLFSLIDRREVRKIDRGEIPLQARQELFRRQRVVSSQEKARLEWDKYRRSANCRPVIDALRTAVGIRQRCLYCCDSRSADVDHFIPIGVDFTKAFKWSNFIWVCPECNRRKGKKFPIDSMGVPLIIDPTRVDPWDHLILDTATGYLAPRFVEDDFDPMGEATLDVLSCINFESVTEGRKRIIRRYYEAVNRVLEANGSPRQLAGLMREVKEDEYGVSTWFALRDGAAEDKFLQMKEDFPRCWRAFVRVAMLN
ncbi:HNH endonuclease signature motif containing protein [Streptomyces lichenis]|uniref:HNH endonuclease signature motif containing protein n=1 Tax=Streptomyces lichenis TaxID=2306967 RepID=UPI0035577DFC